MTPKLGKQNPDHVLRVAADLEARLATIAVPRHGDFNPHHDGCRRVIAELTSRRDARATISEGRDGWRISMLGLRATGTAGFVTAARNWIAQAREKADNTKTTAYREQ